MDLSLTCLNGALPLFWAFDIASGEGEAFWLKRPCGLVLLRAGLGTRREDWPSDQANSNMRVFSNDKYTLSQ